jgi:hypothetical protein
MVSRRHRPHQTDLYEIYFSPISPIGIQPPFRAHIDAFGMHNLANLSSMCTNNGSLVHDMKE